MEVNTIQLIIQRAINLFDTAAQWSRSAAMKAHMSGLQGEKRRLRYLYRRANNIVDVLSSQMWDLFCVEMVPEKGSVDVSALLCPRSTMAGIMNTTTKVYSEGHQLANELVAACYRPLAKPLYDYIDCLFEVIRELHRAHFEYDLANYDYHHVSRYQVAYYNIHDEYEEKERSQGYNDYHEA